MYNLPCTIYNLASAERACTIWLAQKGITQKKWKNA